MIAWLWRIIVGNFHNHEWQTIIQRNITCEGVQIGLNCYLKCSVCGNWKLKSMKT